MTPGLLWLLAGLALCGAEMLAPGVFLLWIGMAACGVGALTEWTGLGFPAQVASFAGLLGLLLSVPALLGRRPPGRLANVANDDLVGRQCRAIAFVGATGRVRLGDGSWAARMVSGGAPAAEASLRVVGRDGTTLLVAAADA